MGTRVEAVPRMMMINRALVVVVALSSTAIAGPSWTKQVSYRAAQQTTIKVLEPEGFAFSVETSDGAVKTGTAPDIVPLPSSDGYVKVTLTAPDGAVWTNKVEVRARNQTELVVGYKAEPAAQPSEKARKFMARLTNGGKGCGKTSPYRTQIYVDFLRSSDGTSVAKPAAQDGELVSFELPAGKYDARVYVNNGEWTYITSVSLEAPAKDGWIVGYGCANGAKTATLIAR